MLSALPVGAASPSDVPAHPQKDPNTAVSSSCGERKGLWASSPRKGWEFKAGVGKQELSKSMKSYCKGEDRSSESLLCAPVFRNSGPWEEEGHEHSLLLPVMNRVELGRTGEHRSKALPGYLGKPELCCPLSSPCTSEHKARAALFLHTLSSPFPSPQGLRKAQLWQERVPPGL